MGYVDLHSHVLPAVDDGASDLPASIAMLQALAELGFERVYATPHQKALDFTTAPAELRAAHERACAAAAAAGLRVGLGLAAENFWDHQFFERVRDGSVPRYDDGRAFLFEIAPAEVPARFEESLFHMAARGLLPVMAHPERYVALHRQADRLERLARSCALVVDLAALGGGRLGWGGAQGRVARRLVADRVAHAAASDLHSPGGAAAIARGLAWIERRLGAAAATRLLDENPRRIAAGELPDP